eukprot:1882160-Amphidinium_carterae.1
MNRVGMVLIYTRKSEKRNKDSRLAFGLSGTLLSDQERCATILHNVSTVQPNKHMSTPQSREGHNDRFGGANTTRRHTLICVQGEFKLLEVRNPEPPLFPKISK